ncbi:MAG: peptidase M23, partial [Sulfurimonas sp.]|nr:peptidase M23 [Sulfurimonas sp.]
MMHLVALFILSVTLVFGASSTDKKISKTSSKLSKYSKNYSKLNKKMSQTARAILKQKRALQKQEKYLKELKKELQLKELSYKENTSQLKLMRKSQKRLQELQEKIEDKLSFVIAKSVSLSLILDETSSQNADSLIESEVLKSMLKK